MSVTKLKSTSICSFGILLVSGHQTAFRSQLSSLHTVGLTSLHSFLHEVDFIFLKNPASMRGIKIISKIYDKIKKGSK